jgi:hypothetical protein
MDSSGIVRREILAAVSGLWFSGCGAVNIGREEPTFKTNLLYHQGVI